VCVCVCECVCACACACACVCACACACACACVCVCACVHAPCMAPVCGMQDRVVACLVEAGCGGVEQGHGWGGGGG